MERRIEIVTTKPIVFRLVELKRTTKGGQSFSTYRLVTADRKWYEISCSAEIRTKLPDLSGKLVLVDATETYSKMRDGYRRDYIAIEDLQLAEPDNPLTEEYESLEDARKLDTLNNL